MECELANKLQDLRHILQEMESIVVAFSGGVDSAFLLRYAVDVLGSRKVVAVTAVSNTLTPEDLDRAKRLAARIGARHIIVHSAEMDDPGYVANTPDRCYICKKIRFGGLRELKERLGLACVADGANMDDKGDYRPGERATKELGIRSPLREAGLYKADIREASRLLSLPNWDLPSQACLASRFPYGTRLTPERLKQVYESEKLLHGLGFRQVRVRYHGDIARIEVPAPEIGRLAAYREQVVEPLKKLGFTYITLDLQGFRSGSLNEVLDRSGLDGI